MVKKLQILEKTFELIMRFGIKSVSLDDISRNIGISKKTIYQYFSNKRELIGKVVDNFIKEDEKIITQLVDSSDNAIEGIVNIAKHVLQFLDKMSPTMIYDTKKYFPKIWESIETGHFDFIRQTIESNIIRGQKEGFYIDDVDPDIVSRLYVSLTFSLSDENLFPSKSYHKKDLFSNLISYHLRSLLTDKGRELYQKQMINNKA